MVDAVSSTSVAHSVCSAIEERRSGWCPRRNERACPPAMARGRPRQSLIRARNLAESSTEPLDVTETLGGRPRSRGRCPREEPVLVSDGEEGAVLLDVRHHACNPRPKPRFERTRSARTGCSWARSSSARSSSRAARDGVLVLEVVVDCAHRDARAGRDVLETCPMETALGEDDLGRVEDCVAEEGAGLVATTREGRGVHRVNRCSFEPRAQARRVTCRRRAQSSSHLRRPTRPTLPRVRPPAGRHP